jgi:hypothetical protein
MASSFHKRFWLSSIIILAPAFLVLSGCSSEDTVSNGEPVDLTGSWEMTTTTSTNSCGLTEGETDTDVLVITDNNGAISIINFNGHWGDGSISGQNVSFTGSEISRDPCLATRETGGSGTISASSITGTFTTTVTYDPDSCSGYADCTINTNFVMTKMAESPCMDRANFGDPDSSDYVLPFPVGAAYEVYQSYCCPTGGHRDQLAYDFTMPIGDTVVAARGGVVRQVREDSPDNGQGEGEHNYIFVEHDDGTTAFYAHLMQNEVMVEPDDTVETGEPIALSGNSGYSAEPHLHFGVYADYPTVEGDDIPVNFKNADGPFDNLGGLIRWETYTALPY